MFGGWGLFLDDAMFGQKGPILKRLLEPRRGELDSCREYLETAESLGLFSQSRLRSMLSWLALLDLDPARAEMHLRLAIEANPSYATYHFDRYRVLNMLTRYKDAIASLRRAIAIKPDNEYYNWHMAVMMIELDRLSEAVPSLEQVIRLEGTKADAARGALAEILLEDSPLRDLKRAEKLLRSFLERHPNHASAGKLLEEALRQQDKQVEADRLRDRINRDR